ncbi:MAG TPA: M48 family metallopeptidase [Candidatus Sulfotelmatobacter sp.]|nr:M48 family metallopeptidase [Candidatus Sulfotelmatobacter sp.]
MRLPKQMSIGLVFAASLIAWPLLAAAQSQTPPPPSTTQTSQTQPQNPCPQPQAQNGQASQTTSTPSTQQNPQSTANGQACADQTSTQPAPQTTKSGQPGSDQPVQQQKTVHPKNAQEDVDAIGNRNPGKGVNFYSIEREIALGKQLAQEVERTSKMIDDPVVTEYVNRVGQNLVRNSDARVPFTIKVIDSDEVNAFALPGGFFYVNSGLILRAQEESELAGVMAHEISHVIARHGTKQATKADIMQIGAMAAMIFVPYGWAGYGIYEGMNLAIPLTFLKFSRDAEREADFLGLQYMYKAGYDPNSYVTFFERIQADEKRRPGTIPKVFSTHPPTPERIADAQKEIARILPEKDEYIVTTSEFDQVKARLRNVMFARKVQQGPNKPTLRTKTEQTDKTKTGQGQGDPNSSDDDRPTLKRRPDSDPSSP